MTENSSGSAAPTYDEAMIRARSVLGDAQRQAPMNPAGADALTRVANAWVGMACAIANNTPAGTPR